MTTTPSVDVGLWTVLEVYLTQRRALGFRLVEEERHARRFLEWLQAHGHAGTSFSVAQALSWAQGDGSLKNSYQCQRLSAVRGLARYCHAIGLNVQVPPANVLPTTRDRRRPHIYTQGEVDALIDACPHAFTHPLVQATMAAVIALLAVTGMRPGEVVRLRLGDINVEDATLLIRANKHGPDRLIPLHPTTLDALAGYLASPHRQAATPPLEGTLFVTTRGKAYQRATVEDHFQRIRAATGITWEGHAPCLVDLRHTFATRQMIRAYTTDAGNPAATLGLLALWLGHSDPSHTYWYVHTQRGLAANTIASYRDTWRLLIKHLSVTTGTSADQLRLEDLDRGTVTGFLDHLTTHRSNTAATRNARLSAIRVLLAHTLPDHPEHADSIRQILAIPPAKTTKPLLSYLTEAETEALLAAPDTTTWTGRRDQMMLALAISTGLRISELITLTTSSIHTGTSPYVECEGKGRKHRSTPLSATIGDQLRAYLQERSTRPGTALFPGPHGTPLSRDAIEHRLAAHVHTATTSCPSMAGKHITVHTLRHTTAMNLLHAGVDITVIALWLGHEQTSTTDVYLHADTRLKEDALDKTRPPHVTPGMYTPRADILAWLETL